VSETFPFLTGDALSQRFLALDAFLLERQLDLVVSYYKIAGTTSGTDRRQLLQQALTILQQLDQAGLLPPANQGWIQAIAQALEEMDDS